MNRETARVAVLAVCCVVAIALASATLPSPTQVDSSGDGGGSSGGDDRFGLSEDDGDDILPTRDTNTSTGNPGPAPGFCNPVLLSVDVLAVLAGLVLVCGGVLTRLYDLGVGTVFVVIGTLLLAITVLLFVFVCGAFEFPTPFSDSAADPSVPEGEGSEEGSGSGSDDDSTPSVSLPSLATVVLIGLALVGLLVAGLTLRRSGTDEEDESTVVAPNAETDARIGAAAGRAADELEAEDGAKLENAVYRAWAEMTDELSVDRPASSTPAEFASVAVEAGMESEDVDELTDLFEQVRYGNAAPTETRERRAIDALRRIERTHSPDGASDGPSTGDRS